MSWWVYLYGDGPDALEVPTHSEGGTHVMGGIGRAELNITWNYSEWYYQELDRKDGLQWLKGKKAKDCMERLERAVTALGTNQNSDYWKSTRGNAGYALNILLGWARLHPEGVFEVH